MRKYTLTPVIFFLTLALALTFLRAISTNVPTLASGAALPPDLDRCPRVLTGLTPQRDIGGMSFTLPSGGNYEVLALCIPSSNLFSVAVNGATVYAVTEQDPYTRAHRVLIPVEGNGPIHIRYTEGRPREGAQPVLSVATPQIILGTGASIGAILDRASFINAVILGLYAMLCFCCLVMYLGKRSEAYLLFLAAGTALMLLGLAFTSGSIHLSYSSFRLLRPLLYMMPVAISVYICLNLFKEQLPRLLRPFTWPPVLLLELAAAMVLQLGAPTIQYYVVRFLLWIPLLAALPLSRRQMDRRRLLILAAFALSEGMSLFPYAMARSPLPAYLMFIRLSDLGNLLFITACMVVIIKRFCDKFAEAETLSAELAEINASLEAKVAERTQELERQQAHKHALMTNIFHDLRSPLFAIHGRLDSFQPADAGQEEFLEVTRGRLAYAERLTEDLFLLAKLENGELLYDESDVDLGRLVHAVLEACLPSAQAKELHITSTVEDPSPQVWGDSYRLQQALVNLVDNAILYTPAGGSVQLTLTGDESGHILRLRDNGPGIPPDKLEHIFERYYVAEPRGSRRSSGLGLAIAHELIAAHGGTLTAESTLGQGTCFTVKLPPV